MRKLITSVALLSATSTLACSFSVGTGRNPQNPGAPGNTPGAAPAPAPPPAAAPTGPQVTAAGGRIGFGRRSTSATATNPNLPPPSGGGTAPAGGGTTPPAGTATAPTPPAAPSAPAGGGLPVMSGANPFGSGNPVVAAGAWKGTIYWIPAGTKTMPQLGSMSGAGLLFSPSLSVPPNTAMTGGFPGIDPNRNENFAIRWEAPLVVEAAGAGDYTIRVSSDDGSIVSMDGMVIVNNDGEHTAQDKSGPVHLVAGTHLVQVDYFQATGPVNLQLWIKKAGGTEIPFPNKL